jgi:hypothetical protein
MEEKKDEGFTVRDRRTASADTSAESKESSQEPAAGQAGTAESGRRRDAGPQPEMDFSSFILSLTATAQMSLGLLPDPHTNLMAQSLPAAKQMIDIIGMLKEKTKGNLGQEEQALIDTVLTNLRMVYVRAAEGKK